MREQDMTDLERLINQTRELNENALQADQTLDDLLRRVGRVQSQINTLRKYQNFVDSANSTKVSGSKRDALVEELQRENKLIMAYQRENQELKASVNECLGTIKAIRSRHRALLRRIKSEREPLPLVRLNVAVDLIEASSKFKNTAKLRVNSMVESLDAKMSYADESFNADLERFARLKRENRTLREMLKMACISNPRAVRLFSNAIALYAKKQEHIKAMMDPDQSFSNTILRRPSKRLLELLTSENGENENEDNTD